MASHVRVLAILQIVYASLGLLLGVTVFLLFGGIAAIVGFSAPLDDSLVAVPVLTVIGGFAATMIILLSLPRLIAGIGLLKHRGWGRILTIIVSVLGLIDFPVGTGLGIYALWVLTQSSAAAMFEPRPGTVART
jgi:hypothetical protein